MEVTKQPPPIDIPHDVFDGVKSQFGGGLVMHGQHNAGDDLVDQHQKCQGTEEIEKIEVFGCVVLQ